MWIRRGRGVEVGRGSKSITMKILGGVESIEEEERRLGVIGKQFW